MFGKILDTPLGRKTFKRVMVDALRAGTPTSKVTTKEKIATKKTETKTQANLQKKKKKKLQRTSSYLRSGTGSKSKTRSLIDPM